MVKTSVAKLVKFENMRDLQDRINQEILDASIEDLDRIAEDFGLTSNTYVTQIIVQGNEAVIIFTNEQERNHNANSNLVRF